jgi:hypothetical protein
VLAERHFEPAPARCDDLHAAVGLAIAMALKASLLDTMLGAPSSAAELATEQPAWRFGVDALAGLAVMPGSNFGADLYIQRALSRSLAMRVSALGLWGPFGSFPHEAGGFDTTFPLPGRCSQSDRPTAFDVFTRAAAQTAQQRIVVSTALQSRPERWMSHSTGSADALLTLRIRASATPTTSTASATHADSVGAN